MFDEKTYVKAALGCDDKRLSVLSPIIEKFGIDLAASYEMFKGNGGVCFKNEKEGNSLYATCRNEILQLVSTGNVNGELTIGLVSMLYYMDDNHLATIDGTLFCEKENMCFFVSTRPICDIGEKLLSSISFYNSNSVEVVSQITGGKKITEFSLKALEEMGVIPDETLEKESADGLMCIIAEKIANYMQNQNKNK